jgi:hypothetical protein
MVPWIHASGVSVGNILFWYASKYFRHLLVIHYVLSSNFVFLDDKLVPDIQLQILLPCATLVKLAEPWPRRRSVPPLDLIPRHPGLSA